MSRHLERSLILMTARPPCLNKVLTHACSQPRAIRRPFHDPYKFHCPYIYSDANKREKRRQTLFSILRDVFISTTYFMSSTFFYTNCVFYMYFRIIGYCILAFVLCLVSRHFPQIHIFSFRANQAQDPYTPLSDHNNYRNLPMIHNLCLTCIPLVVYQTRKMQINGTHFRVEKAQS
jgi:hypothetical protein